MILLTTFIVYVDYRATATFLPGNLFASLLFALRSVNTVIELDS